MLNFGSFEERTYEELCSNKNFTFPDSLITNLLGLPIRRLKSDEINDDLDLSNRKVIHCKDKF